VNALDPGSIGAVLGLLVTGLVVVFTAAAEVSLVTLSRSRARQLIDEGVPRAKALQTLLEDPPRFITSLMILKAAAYVGAAALAVFLALKLSSRWQIAVPLALILVGFALLAIQAITRGLAMRSPEATALRMGPPMRLVAALLTPIALPLRALGSAALGRSPSDTSEDLYLSEDGLRFLINVGEEPGLIEEDEKEMIAGIFELSETVAREVMVPRIDLVAIDETTSLPEALDLIIRAGHSRIPVYQGTVDNIQGVLYAKDLLQPFREGRHDVPIVELMRPAYFVPESKKVDELLHELQQRKVHIAIVVDEYGGTGGVVTIEDLLEEIVGDIQDEYDSELPMVVPGGENEYLFDARIDLDEVSRLVGVELPSEASDTLGGFIFSQLGRVPMVGSQVQFGPLAMEVQAISGRRIQQVRVTRHEAAESEAAAQEAQPKRSLSAFTSMF
jgi:putative hemolysin